MDTKDILLVTDWIGRYGEQQHVDAWNRIFEELSGSGQNSAEAAKNNKIKAEIAEIVEYWDSCVEDNVPVVKAISEVIYRLRQLSAVDK